SPVHVGHWGTFVTTPEISDTSAKVDVHVTVDNDSSMPVQPSVGIDIFEASPEGHPVGSKVAFIAPVNVSVPSGSSGTAVLSGGVSKPNRWSVEHPRRYVAVASIRLEGTLVDQYETPFGIRTIQFTSDNGFLLNGVRVPLKGVCDHHDLGALGAAMN